MNKYEALTKERKRIVSELSEASDTYYGLKLELEELDDDLGVDLVRFTIDEDGEIRVYPENTGKGYGHVVMHNLDALKDLADAIDKFYNEMNSEYPSRSN